MSDFVGVLALVLAAFVVATVLRPIRAWAVQKATGLVPVAIDIFMVLVGGVLTAMLYANGMTWSCVTMLLLTVWHIFRMLLALSQARGIPW